MNEKSISSYTGEWRLPQFDILIPGKLLVNKELNNIYLELYTDIFFDKTPIDFKNRPKKEHKFHTQINGNIQANELVTLCNCLLIRTESIGGSLSKLTYKVDYIFLNAHLKKVSELKIKTINITYPYLSRFFDGYDFFQKNFKNLTERVSRSKPIKISENFKIIIIDEYYRKYSNNDRSFKMEHSKTLEFQYKNTENFNTVLNHCKSFSNLIAFNTKKKIGFKLNHITVLDNEIENIQKDSVINTNSNYCEIINFDNDQNLRNTKNFINQNKMYFSKFNTDDDNLKIVIKKWFNNYDFIPIYDFYIDSDNWYQESKIILSNVMFNNKFLNLIQGLESYYDILDIDFIKNNDNFTKNRQKIINNIEDKILEKWLLENLKFPKTPVLSYKLDYLIKDLRKTGINLDNFDFFLNEYSLKAKDFRHKLSHGRIETTYQGQEFEQVYYFSKFILCFCILKTLGFNNLELKNILKSNENINEYLNKVLLQ